MQITTWLIGRPRTDRTDTVLEAADVKRMIQVRSMTSADTNAIHESSLFPHDDSDDVLDYLLRGSKPRSFRTSEVTVKRTLGTISPETATVDAGGTADFAITYTFTEDMLTGLIEVRLPVGWADGLPPRVFSYEDRPTTADEKKADIAGSDGTEVTSGYVHLDRIRVTAMAEDPDRIRDDD